MKTKEINKDKNKKKSERQSLRKQTLQLTTKQKFQVLGVIGMIFVLVTIISALTYLLTDFLYKNVFHVEFAPFVVHVINSVVSFILCFITMFILSRIVNPDRNPYEPILEAMSKIATGDFDVNIGLNESQKNDHGGMLGELAKSVNNMASELNKMEQMRQEFISNVSHEIQSPLTSIRGFAQALQNEELSQPERKHYLEIIEIETTRISRISENLLKLASLEAEQVKFEPKTYRLDKQIRRLVLAAEPQWSGKEIEMDVALCEVEVTADEDLMSQVWVNLIHNSLKFTPEGGKICLELHQQPEKVDFLIKDSGIGIESEAQEHIFERFYKADKARTQSNGGSGLGLSIAHKIVEMHQGSISVASQPGMGATFQVSLPISKN